MTSAFSSFHRPINWYGPQQTVWSGKEPGDNWKMYNTLPSFWTKWSKVQRWKHPKVAKVMSQRQKVKQSEAQCTEVTRGKTTTLMMLRLVKCVWEGGSVTWRKLWFKHVQMFIYLACHRHASWFFFSSFIFVTVSVPESLIWKPVKPSESPFSSLNQNSVPRTILY